MLGRGGVLSVLRIEGAVLGYRAVREFAVERGDDEHGDGDGEGILVCLDVEDSFSMKRDYYLSK